MRPRSCISPYDPHGSTEIVILQQESAAFFGRCPKTGPFLGVRRNTPGESGCIGGLQARVLVPAPPNALPIATLPPGCPIRPSTPPPSPPSGREARGADRVRLSRAWSALCGLLPQRPSARIAEYHFPSSTLLYWKARRRAGAHALCWKVWESADWLAPRNPALQVGAY